MRLAMACDHRGFSHKVDVVRALSADGHEILDLGTSSTDPVDYPDYARLVGLAVREGRVDAGILICGSGAGVSIAANKLRGVRAALCHELFTARQSREDDDANILCLGADVVSVQAAVALARTFLGARFSGLERHVQRLGKIRALEEGELPPPRPAARGGSLPGTPAVAEARARLERLDAGRRLWKRDAGLWSDQEAVRSAIANRLGWLQAPVAFRARVEELSEFAASVRADGFTDLALIGMGGSTLAAEVLAHTFPREPGGLALTVLDTTDPGAITAAAARLKPSQTLFVVASKSGTTTESLALYRFFRAEVERQVDRAGLHFVAITDAGSPLERLATDAGFRRTFLNPLDIGGRFSALSCFGLVPAALLGVDPARLLEAAAAMAAACGPEVPVADNPGLALGAVLGGLEASGRDKVTLVLSPALDALGAWLEQLLSGSTGKRGRGLVVVHGEPPAAPDTYGNDRVFVAVTLGGDPAVECVVAPLEAAGHPVVRIALADRADVGGEFFRWQVATAAAGAVLEVNPFDEPNVSQTKEATQAALATFRERGRLPEWPADGVAEIAQVLRQARPGDYIAILAFLAPDPETASALQSLRGVLRDRTRLPTTLGHGPRYLHATGQLHKGGPPTGIFLVLTGEDQVDVAIPGERHGFATLKTAQALGDVSTLRAAHRRALWVPLAGAPARAIEQLAADLARR